MFKPIELAEILQREDFDGLYRREKHPRVKMRYLAMSLLKKGKSHKEVGEILQVHEKTVLKWIRQLKADGIEGTAGKNAPALLSYMTFLYRKDFSIIKPSPTKKDLKLLLTHMIICLNLKKNFLQLKSIQILVIWEFT